MSLNAWGGTMSERLVPYLAAARPDVLCLQEVTHTPGAVADWLQYIEGDKNLPQRPNLFADVSRALPEHCALFRPASRGALWDGPTAVPSFFGLAAFTRKDLPIIGEAVGFVHGAFSPDGFGAHPRPRDAQVIRVYDADRDRYVTIAQMHGLRELAGKGDTPARREQAQRFAALIEQVQQAGDDVVVCGDFNVEPDSETLALLAARGLTELVTARGCPGTRTSLYDKPGRFADYMLVSAGLADADFEVVRDPEVSDHCPLVLSI